MNEMRWRGVWLFQDCSGGIVDCLGLKVDFNFDWR